jgi:transcriptional regulator with XRE-family HTH domain
MEVELKEIHVGEAIKKELEKQKMTKTEFGHRIGVPQQHINRILERETMETNKLVKVCRVLDLNIFALFCKFPTQVNAYLAAVSMGEGDAENKVHLGDAAILAQLESCKSDLKGAQNSIALMREQIEQLKSQMADKDQLISLYRKLSDK